MELDRLIETERRNEELVRHATAQAAEIVRAATEAAAHREAALADEIAAALRASADALAVERDRRIAEHRAQARAEVARYDGVAIDAIRAAGAALVRELVLGRSVP